MITKSPCSTNSIQQSGLKKGIKYKLSLLLRCLHKLRQWWVNGERVWIHHLDLGSGAPLSNSKYSPIWFRTLTLHTLLPTKVCACSTCPAPVQIPVEEPGPIEISWIVPCSFMLPSFLLHTINLTVLGLGTDMCV
jgi:hypothetical protein